MKLHIEERYRDRVAWTLSNLFRCEIRLPNTNSAMQQTPRLTDFLVEYHAKCSPLLLPSNHVNILVQNEPAMPVFKTLVKMIAQVVILSLGFQTPQLQVRFGSVPVFRCVLSILKVQLL